VNLVYVEVLRIDGEDTSNSIKNTLKLDDKWKYPSRM
jgi:hypothetical protein